MGYVYVINVENTTFRKVGHSDQDPDKRLAMLQTGCPYLLVLEHVLETGLHREIERLLHVALAPHHVRGEWFDIPLSQVMGLLEELEPFLEHEALGANIVTDDEPVASSTTEEVPRGYARCSHCQHVYTVNNIRRHMQTCHEYR